MSFWLSYQSAYENEMLSQVSYLMPYACCVIFIPCKDVRKFAGHSLHFEAV